MFPYGAPFLIIMVHSPSLLCKKSLIHTSDSSDSQTIILDRFTNMILGDQCHSLLFLRTRPKKIPLDFVKSVSKFSWNFEKTQGVSGDALEVSFEEGDLASLAQKVTLPTSKFLKKLLNEILPKRVRSIRPERETQISTRERAYGASKNFSNFFLS